MRKWLKIVISVCIIGLIIALILVIKWWLTPSFKNHQKQKMEPNYNEEVRDPKIIVRLNNIMNINIYI